MHILDRSLRRSMRMAGRLVARRDALAPPEKRLVSFSFDDFPLTAVENGARLLEARGAHGTFYAALGLAGTEAPCGRIGTRLEMLAVAGRGHECGCHTFGHLDCVRRKSQEVVSDCRRNQRMAHDLTDTELRSFSYPYGAFTPRSKRALGEMYGSCRTGEKGINAGTIDLSALYSVPLYESDRIDTLHSWVDSLVESGGWLIFYTHDVSESPTRWGCSTGLLARILDHCIGSGVEIVTVAEGVAACTASPRVSS